MSYTSRGAAAYAAYSAAVGGLSFQGQQLPGFAALGQLQQTAWAAAADTAGFAVRIGDWIVSTAGVRGRVSALTIAKEGKRSVWIEGTDTTGRPFEHYVLESEIAEVTTAIPGSIAGSTAATGR